MWQRAVQLAQHGAGQGRAGQSTAGQGRAGQAGQGRAGQGRAGQLHTEQRRARNGTMHDSRGWLCLISTAELAF